jgi:hypothetical protein
MAAREFPGRDRSVREIATEKAKNLLVSAGMMSKSKRYRDFLAALTKIYEEEQHTIQVNLVMAESLQALTAGNMISPAQHVRLRSLAVGLQRRPPGPDMTALEAFAVLAVKAQLKREKSDGNLLRSNATKEQRLDAIRSTRTLKEAAEELGESERTIRNMTTRDERQAAMRERRHNASRKAATDRMPTHARRPR